MSLDTSCDQCGSECVGEIFCEDCWEDMRNLLDQAGTLLLSLGAWRTVDDVWVARNTRVFQVSEMDIIETTAELIYSDPKKNAYSTRAVAEKVVERWRKSQERVTHEQAGGRKANDVE